MLTLNVVNASDWETRIAEYADLASALNDALALFDKATVNPVQSEGRPERIVIRENSRVVLDLRVI